MDLRWFKTWYEQYVATFRTGDVQLEDAVKLKYEHTFRVCKEMDALCATLSLSEDIPRLGWLAALFHDIARFEQFRRYRTFSDKKSENHAEMGVSIIERRRIFETLESWQQSILTEAIRFHNAISVPAHLSGRQKLVCRLLRDADKLDIYKIALDHYVNPTPKRKDTVQVGIPDGTTVTKEVVEHVLSRDIVPYEKIKSVADFKMIQLGWVFDLNFHYSFVCVKERGYIEEIAGHLPATEDVEKVLQVVKGYLDTRIEEGDMYEEE